MTFNSVLTLYVTQSSRPVLRIVKETVPANVSHDARVVKGIDSKSIRLCLRTFESCS
jgi:hypothetical protein